MKLFNKKKNNVDNTDHVLEGSTIYEVNQDLYDFAFLNGKKNTIPESVFEVFKFVSQDDYHCFLLVKLTYPGIENPERFFGSAFEAFETKFNDLIDQEDIFERMKNSIYASGDKLASDLSINYSDELDNVDYNSNFIAIRGNELYVWIDGALNIRIYRGEDSIIVNEDETKEQFWGSTTLETGDIIALSTNENLKDFDTHFEDYVLEKKVPDYPSYYLDVQTKFDYINDLNDLSNNLDQDEQFNEGSLLHENLPEYSNIEELEKSVHSFKSENRIDGDEVEDHEELVDSYNNRKSKHSMEKVYVPDDQRYDENKKSLKDRFKSITPDSIQAIFRDSKIGENAKVAGLRLGTIINEFVSNLLDRSFTLIPGKTKADLKRFQNSGIKIYIKLFIFALMIILPILGVFNVLNKGKNNQVAQTDQKETKETQNASAVFGNIEKSSGELNTYFRASNLQAYNTLYSTLKAEITSFKTTFADTPEIDKVTQIESTIDANYFTINKIQPIQKADIIFLGSSVEGSNISDFDVVGDTVYAVDSAQQRILVSNLNQGFDVFLSDEAFKSLNQIVCLEDSVCYLDDAGVGFHSFNISTKEVNSYSQLEGFSNGIVELGKYQNNFYSLVPSERAVYRFQTSANGTVIQTPAGKWNGGGFGNDTLDFGIDGSIFSLSSSAGIQRFFGGQQVGSDSIDFATLEDVSPPLGTQSLDIALTPARDAEGSVRNRFYISDPSNSSINVYNKDVTLQKYSFLGRYQYAGPDSINLNNTSEIVLGNNESHLYILSSNNVFRITVDRL